VYPGVTEEICGPILEAGSGLKCGSDFYLGYVLKGASPEAASQFALKRLEPGGRVIGKRCGTSQNIGAKARKARDLK
jgi:UDP-N-acetyl-D-mannosaminuronate dehydrogenase